MGTVPTDLLTILDRGKSRKVRPKDTEGRVWELKGSDSLVEGVRDQLLGCVLASGVPILVAYDEGAPDEAELAQHLSSIGPARFQVRGQPPTALMRRWLYLGNWQMLSPAAPESLVDLVRAAPSEAAHFVDENQLDFVFDSFHDDVLWVVALRRCLGERGGSG